MMHTMKQAHNVVGQSEYSPALPHICKGPATDAIFLIEQDGERTKTWLGRAQIW